MKILILLLTFMFISSPLWAQKLVFIVNAGNPTTSLTGYQINEIFLKRNRLWPDGEPIRFFDRPDGSVERKFFLEKVMHRSSRELDQYWIGQKLYTGNTEPSQLGSDRMTFSMVSRFKGAIGYVLEQNYQETKGVKKIEVTGAP